jgi:hypothetical protein
MGYAATWTPSDGSPAQVGEVLLNKPTQKENVSDEDYAALTVKCEYLESLFPGLFEAVQKGRGQLLNIAGIDYYAYKAERKYDGQTIILQVEEKRG